MEIQRYCQELCSQLKLSLPYIYPLYGNFKDFTSLLLITETEELFYDDSIKLYEKIKALGAFL